MSQTLQRHGSETAADRRKSRQIVGLLSPSTIWLLLIFALPMLFVLRTSFNLFVEGTTVLAFSFENYQRIFSEPLYIRVLAKSLATGLFVTLSCLLIG